MSVFPYFTMYWFWLQQRKWTIDDCARWSSVLKMYLNNSPKIPVFQKYSEIVTF